MRDSEEIPEGAYRGDMPTDEYTAVHGHPRALSFDMRHNAMPQHATGFGAPGTIDIDRKRDLDEVGAIRGSE